MSLLCMIPNILLDFTDKRAVPRESFPNRINTINTSTRTYIDVSIQRLSYLLVQANSSLLTIYIFKHSTAAKQQRVRQATSLFVLRISRYKIARHSVTLVSKISYRHRYRRQVQDHGGTDTDGR
jgi:hypothetical protein